MKQGKKGSGATALQKMKKGPQLRCFISVARARLSRTTVTRERRDSVAPVLLHTFGSKSMKEYQE